MTKTDLVDLRPYIPENDKSFIYASWLRGLYHGDSVYSLMNKRVFMEQYTKVIDFLIGSKNTIVTIACLKEDPNIILGYSVSTLDKKALHWLFVKKAWRGIGIGKSLISENLQNVTNLTKVGKSLMLKKNLTFNPFLI